MIRNSLESYKMWAPPGAEWTAWAKPVLFADIPGLTTRELNIPKAPDMLYRRTAVIVDLPGQQGVEDTLSFADQGFRPVPLYNGTIGSGKMLVDAREVRDALFTGAERLGSLRLPSDAPPVFMLDANRMNGAKAPGFYDNRWCIFPQDMPSAAYLKSHGISTIIVRLNQPVRPDLSRVLYDYQKAGIALSALWSMVGVPKALTIKKLSFTKEWAYRFKVTLGLKRNATGGFGGKIPDAYERQHSGGYHGYYYGGFG